MNVVDKSRYRDPPRWPPRRTANLRALGLVLRGILAALPYLVLAMGICGAVYAYRHVF
jgi:hypothetical protein